MRNVLVILCDQLRPDFLSFYGCSAIPTPNLDRLASMGVVFDRAITASTVCAPARASMMTGRYVSDHGVWSNSVPFRPGMDLIAERMNALGYRTGAFGKLHHYPDRDVKGFGVSWLMEEGRLGDDDDYLKHLKAKYAVNTIFNYVDGRFMLPEEDYYENCIANAAISYMEQAGSSKPFFAWVSFQGPHTPMDPPKSVKGCVNASALPPVVRLQQGASPEIALYRKCLQPAPQTAVDIQRYRIEYCEMIAYIDLQIGRLLTCLEKTEQMANTTIIFASDHGDLCGDHEMLYKGPHPYPGQMNIPLVVANHPQLRPGTRSPHLANNLDIPGTALAIAGADRGIGVARSLLDLAQEQPADPREVNLSEFCDSIRTIEDQRYRFSYYPFTQEVELFDLERDSRCMRNLAGTLPDVENRMLKHLVDFSICNRQIRIEASDLVPGIQRSIVKKHPNYLEDFKIYWPATRGARNALRQHGLDPHFDRALDGRPVVKGRAEP